MNDSESEADPLVQLAEEFASRFRRGLRPSVAEYALRYPEHADRIVLLFPAMVEMEQLGSVGGSDGNSFVGTATVVGPAPTQLGEYRILREIARGGMGIVYEAIQESLGRHVALKVFPGSRLMSPTHLERFRREARAAARLHHTNIVPVFGVGEHEGVHYFAMQFIQGQSLDRVLHELANLRRRGPSPPEADARLAPDLDASIARGLLSGRFPDAQAVTQPAGATDPPSFSAHDVGVPVESRAGASSPVVMGDHSELGNQSTIAYARSVARVGVQVAEALAYSHQQGILHRDIKPANLLLDTRGAVWVSDFGLVKEEGSDELTTHGDFVGTLRYMAPERFQGRSDPRSDVYSLGLTLYEMMTLRPAFAASDRARLVERVQHEEPPRPRKIDASLPHDLETIVLKATAKEPGRRYATATAMADDLRRFLADRPVEARRVAAWERAWRWCRRNPGLASSTASAAILLVVIAVGSVASASRLGAELLRTTHAQQAERDAKKDALDKLWRSHLARAQAGRFSGRPGQRLDSLEAVRNAAQIARAAGVSEERVDGLRNEAIACLALPDMRPGPTSVKVPSGTTSITFDGDYQRYALGDAAGVVSVYRLGDEAPIVRLPGLRRVLTEILLSPDGRFVAGHSSGEFQIWEVDEGRAVFSELKPVHALNRFMAESLFSADSRLAAAVGPDGSISVWDLRTGREIQCLRTGNIPNAIAIHPNGLQIAVADDNHMGVVIWDIKSGRKATELLAGDSGSVSGLAWHPDGGRLALGFRAPTSHVEVWDVATRRILATLEGHVEDVTVMAFHPSRDILVSQSHDGTNRLWDAGTGRPLINWLSGISNLHFNREGTVCGLLRVGGRARLVEVADGREYRTLVSTPGSGRGKLREGDIDIGGLLAVGTDDGTRLWDLATGREVAFLPIGWTDSVSFVSGPDRRELITCGHSGLRRWPLRNDSETPGRLRLGPPTTVRLPFIPTRAHVRQDSRVVAVACERSGTAVVVDLATEAVQCTLGPLPSLSRAVLSPDGRWAATHGWHAPSVKIWDARNGAMVKDLQLGKMNNAFFSPDGRTLVTSRGDEYRFWDVPSWQPGRRVAWEIPSYPGWVAFSPDRKLMALELSPAVVHLIDSLTGRTLAKLEDPRSDRAQWLGFTPDGSQLVAIASYSSAIHVWDLRAIRRHLAAMGLDWESPPYPEAPAMEAPRSVVVELPPAGLKSAEDEATEKARRVIETRRLALASRPDSADANNQLAWAILTAPEALRDTAKALALAERASELDPGDLAIRNTLGVAFYRAGRHREAADTLGPNLARQKEKFLASDLYFLAMCHHQLGEKALARAYYVWADRSSRLKTGLSVDEQQIRAAFRAEAELLMGE
jgi:serine/threonine protein kinase/WD40 repeat protein